MNLAALQQDFRAWLVASSPESARRFGADAAAGLAVYQNNYRAQLVGCLEISFPRVREWMGNEAFLAAAIAHIDSHPPQAWTLDAYADGFGETLTRLYPNNPDLHELAWIEHALSWAFVAPDATPLPAAALAGIDWDAATLVLVPSLTMRMVTTNVHDIWNALSDGVHPPDSKMLAAPSSLVVWRRQFSCFMRQVDDAEREALIHIREDGRFDALCTRLVERLGEDEGIARAGALLADWLGNELIAGIETN